mmetsp:Transcript_18331/g.15967  ORF Transcript_18331/g.15967 Transcript_18331/m.15967 type:complete len:96 (-) Transcript_18331:639-926(-)
MVFWKNDYDCKPSVVLKNHLDYEFYPKVELSGYDLLIVIGQDDYGEDLIHFIPLSSKDEFIYRIRYSRDQRVMNNPEEAKEAKEMVKQIANRYRL